MGEEPARQGEIAAEVAQVTGSAPDASARIARAIGTYAALDVMLGDVLATIETGFRGDASRGFDAAMRDRAIRSSPRAVFAALAPRSLAEISRR